jgi:uncharacterized protein YbaA (DUF1428 family)
MSKYVDGFVLPLPKDKVEEYRAVADTASRIFKEHGALEYVECVLDDADAQDMTPFPQMANCGPDETVVFAWVIYASKEARDAANQKIMADPRMQDMMGDSDPSPFDYTRMAYGGFRTLVWA